MNYKSLLLNSIFWFSLLTGCGEEYGAVSKIMQDQDKSVIIPSNYTEGTETFDFKKDESSIIRYNKIILPFLNKSGKEGSISGQKGMKISYRVFTNPQAKANIVIVNGLYEFNSKYLETIYDLYQNGFSVYTYDHRGQGASERFANVAAETVHVESFDEYVADLNAFINEIVVKDAKPKILLAHSMGGLIASLYLEKFPKNVFSAAVLSAPMFQINLGGVPTTVARTVASSSIFFGYGKKAILGIPEFDIKKISSSSLRVQRLRDFYNNEPITKQSYITNNWLYESFKASESSIKNSDKIKTPVLLLQARNDVLVMPEVQNEFCRNNSNCSLYIVDNSFHEMFNEVQSIRIKVLEKSLGFISSILKQ